MKSSEDFNALNDADLQEKLVSLRKEQFNLRMQRFNGSLDKTHGFKIIRRKIAQVKTILSLRNK